MTSDGLPHQVRTLKEQIYQQQNASAQHDAARVPIPPEQQTLIFAGRALVDEALIADYESLHKEATLHLLPKGHSKRPVQMPQPPVVAPGGAAGASCGGVSGGDEHTAAVTSAAPATTPTTTMKRASLRLSPCDHSPEFDGSDGWAVVEGVDVSEAQRWYQKWFQHETLGWKDWGDSGNSLMYLLNRCAYPFHSECSPLIAVVCH